ncbi:MAG TPA: FAD-binding oxidoreductase [Steroidobacteraceae bacterium]|nr:FAD-binding oxidoreductase [Steroidobacteraceae bacterium]
MPPGVATLSEVPSGLVSSWGNLIRVPHALYNLRSRHDPFPRLAPGRTVVPYGNGRSYGDSCLNVGGGVVRTRALDRFIHFDRELGLLSCEAGVLLEEILRIVVPQGWFLPVVPGTAQVTVGGAIANDVHGKNHHRAGTFGCHVRQFELVRSDGTRLMCSPLENADWFGATIGGLGLTGVITWAELQLRSVAGPRLRVQKERFHDLESFFALSEQSDRDYEYTVAWIDCLGRGRHLGRGVMQRANHMRWGAEPARERREAPAAVRSIPFVPPVSLVNTASLRLFNTAYYHLEGRQSGETDEDYTGVLFPLDSIQHWNRIYGSRGFLQYQCVVPHSAARRAVGELLESIAVSGLGSFLAVLKRFGLAKSPGMLSFPMEGVTLALDFPNSGDAVRRLFDRLNSIVSAAGGRLYPAKDARMPGALFRSGYPRWKTFIRFIDPACSSSLWRRVMEGA